MITNKRIENSKGNLVFDIDDTITNETEFIKQYGPIYIKERYGIDAEVKNPNGANLIEVFGLDEFFRKENPNLSDEEIEKISKKANSSYNGRAFTKYIKYPLREDSAKIINELYDMGYLINFVSLRGIKKDNEKPKDKIIRTRVVPYLTKGQLKREDIKYDRLYLVEKTEDKKQIIEELNALMVFDDTVDVIESLDGVNTIAVCATTPHNELTELKNKKAIKVPFKYNEIMAEIKKMEEKTIRRKPKKSLKSQIKKLTTFEKVYTETVYRVIRGVGRAQAYKKYKPLVIGEENIPSEKKPEVIIGNHRNIKDPLITIAMVKKPTHFAALKRMFENNENMFGEVGENFGTYFTTFLVKSMGALPVARRGDTDYIKTNLQTFSYFNDYLEKNSSVAIYPEGTLNRNPEENGNILELKSNHAFKMAKDSGALIYPLAIKWVPKEVQIENRVIAAFLKPIDPSNLTVEEIENQWLTSMDKALNSMNKITEELDNIQNGDFSITEKNKGEETVKKLTKSIQEA